MIIVNFLVSMYPYHNKIKQRIKNGELVKYEYVASYKHISPCLLLYFNTEPYVRPIREHRFAEYQPILEAWSKGEVF
ncbi:hypothetical protein [Capnocytophaga canimorsus]|nr:hypothetical protein [Capnocytophaga canimorsus]WGU67687.1 hypothetical protein QIU19_09270 [Capnocytophaga canimorsus]WGU71193.1 hypothetical protein QIU18_04515 [Capnocytophaga canimorsus]